MYFLFSNRHLFPSVYEKQVLLSVLKNSFVVSQENNFLHLIVEFFLLGRKSPII